eukprot:6191918-Pleurochrysis_carterae.AAC.2
MIAAKKLRLAHRLSDNALIEASHSLRTKRCLIRQRPILTRLITKKLTIFGYVHVVPRGRTRRACRYDVQGHYEDMHALRELGGGQCPVKGAPQLIIDSRVDPRRRVR